MKNIILIGMKGCGKSTIGKLLAKKLGMIFIDMDSEVEKLAKKVTGKNLRYREIFKLHGEQYFCDLEIKVLTSIDKEFRNSNLVLACGGRTPLIRENQGILHRLGLIIYIQPDKETLYRRIMADGIPTFFRYPKDPRKSFEELYKKRLPLYEALADIKLETGKANKAEVVNKLIKLLNQYD